MKLRGKKIPKDTDDIVKLCDIKIPKNYAILVPAQEKIKKKAAYYDENGCYDSPITVIPEINEKGKVNRLMLVDGYINYLQAMFRNEEYIPVKYQYEYIV